MERKFVCTENDIKFGYTEEYESTSREYFIMRMYAKLSALRHYIDHRKDSDEVSVQIRKKILSDMKKELNNFK